MHEVKLDFPEGGGAGRGGGVKLKTSGMVLIFFGISDL